MRQETTEQDVLDWVASTIGCLDQEPKRPLVFRARTEEAARLLRTEFEKGFKVLYPYYEDGGPYWVSVSGNLVYFEKVYDAPVISDRLRKLYFQSDTKRKGSYK